MLQLYLSQLFVIVDVVIVYMVLFLLLLLMCIIALPSSVGRGITAIIEGKSNVLKTVLLSASDCELSRKSVMS